MKWLEHEFNELRYRGKNHLESYFLRAVDPQRPRALWLKMTVLAPLQGEAVAEAWGIYFDGEQNRRHARRLTVPIAQASLKTAEGNTGLLTVGPATMVLGPVGSAKGQLEGLGWDLRWLASANAGGDPLSMYPTRLLLESPVPRLKVLTPFPSLRFSGAVSVFGERVDLSGWVGAQGHNYGTEHPFEYAWGQCVFPAGAGTPETVMEGGSLRIKLGRVTTPRISALVVRRGAREYRFDTLLDTWRQDATLGRWRWTLRLESTEATGSVTFDAAGRPMVCLGYRNPDGGMAYCLNTKLAHVWLNVQEKHGHGFSLESPHGGALEFLQAHPDRDFPEVV